MFAFRGRIAASSHQGWKLAGSREKSPQDHSGQSRWISFWGISADGGGMTTAGTERSLFPAEMGCGCTPPLRGVVFSELGSNGGSGAVGQLVAGMTALGAGMLLASNEMGFDQSGLLRRISSWGGRICWRQGRDRQFDWRGVLGGRIIGAREACLVESGKENNDAQNPEGLGFRASQRE